MKFLAFSLKADAEYVRSMLQSITGDKTRVVPVGFSGDYIIRRWQIERWTGVEWVEG